MGEREKVSVASRTSECTSGRQGMCARRLPREACTAGRGAQLPRHSSRVSRADRRRGVLGQEAQSPGHGCGGVAAAGWTVKAVCQPGGSGRNEVGRDKAGRGVG